MKTFGKILAVAVIVTSVVSMLLSIAGVIGIWQTYSPLVGGLTRMADMAETALNTADQAITQIEPVLTALQGSMVEIQQNVEQMKADLANSQPLADTLLSRLSDDTRPKVEKVLTAFNRLHEAATTLNDTVKMVNSIPFINMTAVGSNVEQVAETLDQVIQSYNDLQARVDQLKAGVTSQVVQPIQDQAAIIEQRLTDALTKMQATQARVQAASQMIAAVKARIGTVVVVLFLLLTFQMLWGMIAQAAAIYLAWMYVKFGRLDIHKLVQLPAEAPAETPAA